MGAASLGALWLDGQTLAAIRRLTIGISLISSGESGEAKSAGDIATGCSRVLPQLRQPNSVVWTPQSAHSRRSIITPRIGLGG
jgi:hypothetical protein